MGNICQNQRGQDAMIQEENNAQKFKPHVLRPNCKPEEDESTPTTSDMKEFMSDLSQQHQNLLFVQPEAEPNPQAKISIKDFILERGEIYLFNQESTRRIAKYAFCEIKQVLGRGSFGKVLLVQQIHDKKHYAMKVVLKKGIKNDRQKRHTMAERFILEKINHPFIVKLQYAFQTAEKLYLVIDFMPGGELFHHLKQFSRFSEDITRFYAAQIVLGLQHLHELKIIYRDLKPENVLLDQEGNIKLADFGLSKMDVDQESLAHSLCGTPEYLAPEIITSKVGHDKTVDWWSLGSLVYEMLSGFPPFYSSNKKQMIQNIIYKPIPIPKYLSEEAKSLLTQLLVVNPTGRLGYGPEGTENVKSHPFFKGLDWDAVYKKKIKPPIEIHIQNDKDMKYFDPFIVKQAAQDSPASYHQELFAFSHFTYNKQLEENNPGEFEAQEDDVNNNNNESLNGKTKGQQQQGTQGNINEGEQQNNQPPHIPLQPQEQTQSNGENKEEKQKDEGDNQDANNINCNESDACSRYSSYSPQSSIVSRSQSDAVQMRLKSQEDEIQLKLKQPQFETSKQGDPENNNKECGEQDIKGTIHQEQQEHNNHAHEDEEYIKEGDEDFKGKKRLIS